MLSKLIATAALTALAVPMLALAPAMPAEAAVRVITTRTTTVTHHAPPPRYQVQQERRVVYERPAPACRVTYERPVQACRPVHVERRHERNERRANVEVVMVSDRGHHGHHHR